MNDFRLTDEALAKMREMVPPHLHDGFERYFNDRIRTGDTLHAMLCNDLVGVIARGDDDVIASLKPTVQWLASYAPSIAWGNAESVHAWLARRDPLL